MSEKEFVEWVWKLYSDMVKLSGITSNSKTRLKKQRHTPKATNFEETMLLNDSVV
jgi:hypothetical protein